MESCTYQPSVQFSQAIISGETGRWYNGFSNTNTSLFTAIDTQSPSLGAAGDTLLQDFITIHQFNTPTFIEFTNINNNTWNVIGNALGSNVPSFSNTATNKSSAARFGEFTVVPSSISAEELISLGSDIANKWCVPYSGPSIKKFRIVNVGSTSVSIGWVGIYKNPFNLDTLSTNLINVNTIYGASGIAVSSGSVSASWSATLMSTAPFQQIPAGEYIQFTLSSVVSNCGFIRLGKITTTGSAKLRFDIQCNATVTDWEKYNLWYHYNGSAVQCTTIDCAQLNSTNVDTYALNNMFMPWKQKYGTTVAISPYNLPRYQATLESSANKLNTWSCNLMAKTWDCNRAINHYLTYQRNGATNTFTTNQQINFKQFVADSPWNAPPYLTSTQTADQFYLASSTQANIDKYSSIDGKYIITDATTSTRFMMTRQDYIPSEVLSVYGLIFKQSCNAAGQNGTDYDLLTLGFMDPNTFHTPFGVSLRNENGRMPLATRLRQSITTGSWYVDIPLIFPDSGGMTDPFDNQQFYANPYYGGFPYAVTNKGTRSLFNYPAHDPNIGRIVDTLDLQKMFTISSMVGNHLSLFYRHLYSYGGYGTLKQDALYNVTAGTQSYQAAYGGVCGGITVTVSNSVCTQIIHKTIGINVINLGASNNSMNLAPFTPPTYAMFRSCTNAGSGVGGTQRDDGINFPNMLSGERMYLLTVVVNTQSNGGFFNSDATMENYIKVYLNGKQINTANRRVSSGSYVTVITSVSTTSTTYPTYFYNSSPLTYGITQISDAADSVGTRYIKYGMLCATNARSLTTMVGRSTFIGAANTYQEGAAGISRTGWIGRNRQIIAETSNLCRATPDVFYSSAEIATHIAGLSKKWGIVMAYRWVTIRNTGTVDFRFNRLGFYGCHSEALSDTAGNTIDEKMGCYRNIMKGFTETVLISGGNPSVRVSCTISSATVGTDGITAVLSQTGMSAPSVSDTTIVTIQPGGSIMIDLADSITCSHVRFGNFASTGDVTLARMSMDLTPTLPESEVKGTPVEHYLKASMNLSDITVGQFPLHSPLTQTNLVSFVKSDGTHLNTNGTYVLYSSLW